MTTGVKFTTNGLSTLLSSERIVPQLIAVYNMANYTHFDLSDTEGTHPGWIRRTYQFDFPTNVFSRPVIIFTSLPNQGYEVYSNGGAVFYQAGEPFTDPIWYVFATDYVTESSSSHGLRIWRQGDHALMYDSGNYHLNIRGILECSVDMTTSEDKFVNYPIGGVSSFSGALNNGAYVIPPGEIYRYYATRFDGYGEWRAFPVCRLRGTTLDIRMMAWEREYTEDVNYTAPSYDHFSKSNGTGLTAMFIDLNMYN